MASVVEAIITLKMLEMTAVLSETLNWHQDPDQDTK